MLNTERELTPSWSLVKPSFDLVKENYVAVLIIVLLPVLLANLGVIILVSAPLLGIIIITAAMLWRVINLPVSYYLQVQAVRGAVDSVQECYKKGLPFWLRVVGFEIFFVIILTIGFILLVVPGLIISRRYYLTPYYIIYKNLPIREAMDISSNQTKPVSAWVWGTFGVLSTFALITVIVSGIPLFGPILSALISMIYVFGPVLRWKEVSKTPSKKNATKRKNS